MFVVLQKIAASGFGIGEVSDFHYPPKAHF